MLECCEYDYACHTTIFFTSNMNGMLYHLHKFLFKESRKSEQMTEAYTCRKQMDFYRISHFISYVGNQLFCILYGSVFFKFIFIGEILSTPKVSRSNRVRYHITLLTFTFRQNIII